MQHGRNAIEFNAAPVLRCAPGGLDNIVMRVTIAVPKGFEDQVKGRGPVSADFHGL